VGPWRYAVKFFRALVITFSIPAKMVESSDFAVPGWL
jgi:hypothetical protein